VIQYFRWYT